MKAGIHPDYREAMVSCACGAKFQTRSTVGDLKVDICSSCHPFFTGTQKIVDTEGRVERFKKKYAKKAVEMARIFARKYTGLTKHFNYVLNREDRDWWGGRIGGRYLMKFGPRYYHAMGIYVLDLLLYRIPKLVP